MVKAEAPIALPKDKAQPKKAKSTGDRARSSCSRISTGTELSGGSCSDGSECRSRSLMSEASRRRKQPKRRTRAIGNKICDRESYQRPKVSSEETDCFC